MPAVTVPAVRPIRLLAIGAPDPASAALWEGLSASDVVALPTRTADDLRGKSAAAGRPEPDVVVILQDWPDQFDADDVRTLCARWPLARVIVAYGPWCQSDGRTRDTWPLAWRVPREHLANRLAAEIEVVRGCRTPLAATADRDEIFLWQTDAAGEPMAG